MRIGSILSTGTTHRGWGNLKKTRVCKSVLWSCNHFTAFSRDEKVLWKQIETRHFYLKMLPIVDLISNITCWKLQVQKMFLFSDNELTKMISLSLKPCKLVPLFCIFHILRKIHRFDLKPSRYNNSDEIHYWRHFQIEMSRFDLFSQHRLIPWKCSKMVATRENRLTDMSLSQVFPSSMSCTCGQNISLNGDYHAEELPHKSRTRSFPSFSRVVWMMPCDKEQCLSYKVTLESESGPLLIICLSHQFTFKYFEIEDLR